MKWVNALGLTFQFISFWFAAPELLGEQTLKRMESGLKTLITKIPVILVMLFCCGYGLTFSVMGIVKGLNASKEGITASEYYSFMAVLTISLMIYLLFIIYYKRINRWLENSIAQPLTQRLIHNNEARQNALLIGAALFSIGFLLQLAVVLWQ
jgi:hypothetical protein